MTNKCTKSFHDEQEELFNSMIPEDLTRISDDKLGELILDFIIKRERIRHGFQADDEIETSQLDLVTISKLQTWDTDDPALMQIEKVLWNLGKDRKDRAIFLLKKIIKYEANNRAEIISSEQQRRASAPRALHPIEELIRSFLEENPRITVKEIERKLTANIGRGIVLDVDELEITPVDEGWKPISVRGLKDRITRLKKKISH